MLLVQDFLIIEMEYMRQIYHLGQTNLKMTLGFGEM